MNNLTFAYWSARKLDRSIPLCEETLRLHVAKLGKDHPATLRTMANLGVNYRDAGRLEEAIPLLEEALDRSQKLQPFPASLVWVSGELAETYDRAHLFAKSEPLYRRALDRAKQQFAAGDPRTAGAMAQLAMNLLQQKMFTDAEPPDAWTTFNTKSLLGGALLGQKKYADAEPLLLTGYEGMKQRELKIPPQGKVRLSEALERLVQLYEATGQMDKAEQWRKELEATRTPKPETKP
jgi:hypothetical protein